MAIDYSKTECNDYTGCSCKGKCKMIQPAVIDAVGPNGPRPSYSSISQRSYMKDGLYQVKTHYLCAGFVVESGKVTRCAPILRKKLSYWITRAKRIST